MDTAYVNGQHLPLAQASLPVLDRGLLFADAVYEVIPVYAGKAFLLDEHLARLEHSLDGIRMRNPHSRQQWQTLLTELIKANGSGDMSLYLQVTRGTAPRRDHRIPEQSTPNIVAFCQCRTPPGPEVFIDGVSAITAEDTRWARCEYKSTSLLANVLAGDDARVAGANEAILVRAGRIMEGASSNVFAVVNGQIKTPRLCPAILPGITRALLLKLAQEAQVEIIETDLSEQEFVAAEEIWLTSSIREIFPVTQLNAHPVGNGKPGPVFAQMRRLIQACYA